MAVDQNRLLLDQLRESGLLRPAQLEQLACLPEARDPDPRALGRQLLQRGWLTRFQVNLVAQGRARDLHIGPYLLLDRLGEGGMGEVFKAQHQHMSRIVALKVIRKDRLRHAKAVSRFYQEVQAAGQLHHPHIVLAFDAGEAGGTHFLSMEFVDGQDLHRMVVKAGPLPVAQTCDYIRQAALGLQHAHERGLVHRDIKPHNLLATSAPSGEKTADGKAMPWGMVKVLDMGLSRWRQGLEEPERGLTREGAVLGTVAFMAPEQARSAHTADSRSDLYSLGCTFYYLLTGRTPFYSESLTQLLLQHQMEEAVSLESIRSDVPAEVVSIVRVLLAKRPEDRIQSAAELAVALEPFCGADGATPQMPLAQAVQPAEENTWATLLGGEENSALVRSRSASTDKTLVGSEDETPIRGKARQAARTDVLGGRKGLVLALAGAGVLGVTLLAVGMALWIRSAPAKVVLPPRTTPQVLQLTDNARAEEAAPVPEAKQPAASGELCRFERHTAKVTGVAFLPDGRRAVSADFDKTVWLWDLRSGKMERGFTAAGQINALAVSADGTQFLTGGLTPQVQIWDVDGNGGPSLALPPGTTVASVAFAPDAGRAIVGNTNGSVLLWAKTGGVQNLKVPKWGTPCSIATSPDSHRALFGCADGSAHLWDLEANREEGQFLGHTGAIFGVALSRDGRQALTGGADGTARLWDVVTRREVHRLRGQGGRILSVALSPDGRFALTGGADPVLRLWDTRSGAVVRRFNGHTGPITSVAFSRDGRQALSGSEDKTVRLWELSKPAASS